MKKGQGLSMNVIIIAALALLVLVVISMIFMSRSGTFVRDSKGCTQLGGICTDVADNCRSGTVEATAGNMVCYDSAGEPDTDKKCCIPGER